jgi:hypothetical protein
MSSFLSTLYPSAKPDPVADKYLYLHENVLHNEIDWCIPTSDKPFVVALCIVRMNRGASRVSYNEERVVFDPTPFLQFVVEYHSLAEKSPESPAMYMFPMMNYACLDNDNQSHFEETCISHAIDILKLEQIPNAPAVSAYKGFVMHHEIVFAVIDYDELAQQFQPSADPPMFAIADELVLQKRILGIPVDPNVSSMLEEHPYMWTIESEGETIPVPLCLYHCCLSHNESYDETYSSHPIYENAQSEHVKEQIDHPLYNEMYVFSKQPLAGVDPLGATPAPYQRYAVFVSQPVMFADHINENRGVTILEKKRQMLTYLDTQNEIANVVHDTAPPRASDPAEEITVDLTQSVAVVPPKTGGAIESVEQESTEEIADEQPSLEDTSLEKTISPESVDAKEETTENIPSTDPAVTDTPATYVINERVASMSDQEVENELDEQLLVVPSMFFQLSSADIHGAWGMKYTAQFVAYE